MMIDISDNIGIVNYTFMLDCSTTIKLSYGHKIVYYFWEINNYVTPELLYFFDFLVFVCSLHSFILIHPDILKQNLTSSHYIKLLAIVHAIKNFDMFRYDLTLKVDLSFLKSIFISPTYSDNSNVNRELQRISMIFIEMHQEPSIVNQKMIKVML